MNNNEINAYVPPTPFRREYASLSRTTAEKLRQRMMDIVSIPTLMTPPDEIEIAAAFDKCNTHGWNRERDTLITLIDDQYPASTVSECCLAILAASLRLERSK